MCDCFCDTVERWCNWWGRAMTWSLSDEDTLIFTGCLASPSEGEAGWRHYVAREIDANRGDLTQAECREFSQEAYFRKRLETVKLVAIYALTAVGSVAIVVALAALVALVAQAVGAIFVTLFAFPIVSETVIGVVVVLTGISTVLLTLANAVAAVPFCLNTLCVKEFFPHVERTWAYINHLHVRARELEIEAEQTPNPVLQGA